MRPQDTGGIDFQGTRGPTRADAHAGLGLLFRLFFVIEQRERRRAAVERQGHLAALDLPDFPAGHDIADAHRLSRA